VLQALTGRVEGGGNGVSPRDGALGGRRVSVRRITGAGLAAAVVGAGLMATSASAATWTNGAAETTNDVGTYASIELDRAGNPVIAHYDATADDLRLTHCNDPLCAGGDESTEIVDATGNVGTELDLELDASGFPVISYRAVTGNDLKLARCNDASCAGGDESISTVETSGNTGRWTSLELDGAENPVIAYYRQTGGNLKLAHCNDANCVGGDESIENVVTTQNVGQYASLALDASGFPVISFYNTSVDDLVLAHCGDANCAGGGESVVAIDSAGNVGQWTSLKLDAGGDPVISYFAATGSDLKVAHCDDANCAPGGNSVVTVDAAGNTGRYTSLELDDDGNPRISYNRQGGGFNDLKYVACDDEDCVGPEAPETAEAPGNVGRWSGLALDAADNPVIAQHDRGSRDLRLSRVFPDSTATPDPHDLGPVEVLDTGTAAVTIVSTGDEDLVPGAITITGPDATHFAVGATDTCTGASLATSTTCTIDVDFTPASPGGKTATLEVVTNEHDSPIAVTLIGTGRVSPPLTPPPPPPPDPPAASDRRAAPAPPATAPIPAPAPSPSPPPAADAEGTLFDLRAVTQEDTAGTLLAPGLAPGATSNPVEVDYRGQLAITGTHSATPGTQVHVFGPRMLRRRSAQLNSRRTQLQRLATVQITENGRFTIRFRVRPSGRHYLVVGDGTPADGHPFWITLDPHLRARAAGDDVRLWARPPQALAGAPALVQERTRGGWVRRATTRFDEFGRATVDVNARSRGNLRLVVPENPGNHFTRATWLVKGS
jgi:hypothetical protein